MIESHGFEVPCDACDDVEHHLRRCGINARVSGVPALPKFHTLPRLAEPCRVAGNIKHASMLEDESVNADNVRIAAMAHSSDFLQRLVAKQQLLASIKLQLIEMAGLASDA